MAEEDSISPVSPSPTFVQTFSLSSTTTASTWTNIPPFEKCDQLCKDLEYRHGSEKSSHLHNNGCHQTLPDAPRIPLDASRITSYCLEDLDTPRMNKLGEKLWWAGSDPQIKPLSQQLAVSRRIQIVEDVSVHCLWTDDIIFLKPLPAYLCSHAFWEYILDPSNDSIGPEDRDRLRATALGFLKTYASLIRHRSDFNIAQRHGMLASFSNISFEAFVIFIKSFDDLLDSTISPRWRFGEIQLDALNFHSAIHLRRWHFNRFESRYGAYFQRFFPVILFLFALFSVILSAMQVIVGARQLRYSDTDTESSNKGLMRVMGAFEWFGTEAIGWSLAFGALLLVWWIGISSAEGWKRRRMMKRVKKRQKQEVNTTA